MVKNGNSTSNWYLGSVSDNSLQTEAQFVVVQLGRDYPKRIWTRIESDAFKERLADGHVIPVCFADVDKGAFDTSRKIGGLTFDRTKDSAQQIRDVAAQLLAKLADSR